MLGLAHNVQAYETPMVLLFDSVIHPGCKPYLVASELHVGVIMNKKKKRSLKKILATGEQTRTEKSNLCQRIDVFTV